ncbi:MAG: nuclear transport factor 2 family protein [Balneolales bacterium]
MNSNIIQQARDVAQQLIRYLGERNLDQLISLFNEKVDWFIPGNQALAPWTGKRETKQEVKAFFELLWINTETLSAEIDHVLAEGKVAIAAGSFSTRMLQTGNIVESPFSIYIEIEEGLITKYRLLEDSFAVSVALTDHLEYCCFGTRVTHPTGKSQSRYGIQPNPNSRYNFQI